LARGLDALLQISAMPDRKAKIFVNLLLQNGKIGAAKRQGAAPCTDGRRDQRA
jgi:hypothetical protein